MPEPKIDLRFAKALTNALETTAVFLYKSTNLRLASPGRKLRKNLEFSKP
jgi:hypothetical protein